MRFRKLREDLIWPVWKTLRALKSGSSRESFIALDSGLRTRFAPIRFTTSLPLRRLVAKASQDELLEIGNKLVRRKMLERAVDVFGRIPSRETPVNSAKSRMIESYRANPLISPRSLKTLGNRLRLIDFLGENLHRIKKTARMYQGSNSEIPDIVYVLWNQGLDVAPDIVQACRRQLKRISGRQEIVELDDSNLGRFLKLEPELLQKLSAHPAHLSDLIRVGLLANHGGYWLDSTVWCEDEINAHLAGQLGTGFFAYRYDKARISSWLLAAEKGNYIVSMLFAALSEYWKENNELLGYFMFHDLFECLYWVDGEFAKAWDAVPFSDANTPHILQRQLLFQTLDIEKLNSILRTNPIQKLTHKTKDRPIDEGTTFHHLTKQ